jgi:hypothetical protein
MDILAAYSWSINFPATEKRTPQYNRLKTRFNEKKGHRVGQLDFNSNFVGNKTVGVDKHPNFSQSSSSKI